MIEGVYMVTVMKRPGDLSGGEGPTRKRTWGYFLTFEEADRAVLGNHTDMFELGYYDLAVVTFLPPGLLPRMEERAWYEARRVSPNKTNEMTVARCDKPKEWARYFGWALE